MPKLHVSQETSLPAETVLTAARDFSKRRAELFRDVYAEHMQVHEIGKDFAEVTEGNPWPVIGIVWERLHYDWSEPSKIKGRVIDSNLFKPGSTWEISAVDIENGKTLVEIDAIRNLKGRGWLIWPLFPTGLAKRDVADYLKKFLARLKADYVKGGYRAHY
jgi:hypothetical protein